MRSLYFTPNTEDVELFIHKKINNNIKQNPNYKTLHLTPTLILLRKRKQSYRRLFRQLTRKDQDVGWSTLFKEHVEVNEFFHWSKDLVYKEKVFPLSRNESHVLTKRAISDILPNRREWLSSSNELMEVFQHFQTLPLSIEELEGISQYGDWEIIIRTYLKYLELLKNTGLEDYSQALIRTITKSDVLNHYTEVIMDGPFLFFEPIHEALIDRCEALNIPLSFIVPFEKREHEPVNPSYKVIQKTYGLFVPENDWIPISRHHSQSTYLEQIPSLLFTDRQTKYDDSITIHRYDSLEQELNEVISKIKRNIDKGYSSINKIAIVTPNSKKLRPVIREISENIGIDVEVPERSFLGLTFGEFLNFVYKIKTDERKFEMDSYLDTSIFKRILSSGWFEQADKTILSYQTIEDIFFEDIVTLQQWGDRFDLLSEIKPLLKDQELEYHPLHFVPEKHIDCWIEIVNKVRGLQESLFSKKDLTISEHAQLLLSGLRQLVNEQNQVNYILENNVFGRIEEIVSGLVSQDRLRISPQEFGDLLFSLFKEQEDLPEGYDNESTELNADSKGILVTSLQNIAYQKYNYIYAIQFTQENYPIAQHSKWPLHNDILWKLIAKSTRLKLRSQADLERIYADREKYYFYLSFLSANIAYGISYSKFENGNPMSHSHYLNDISKTIGIEEENPLDPSVRRKREKLEELLQRHNILNVHTADQKFSEEDQSEEVTENQNKVAPTYSLDEIGVFKLCPKRFQYMNLFRNKNVYTTPFQITFYLANLLSARATINILSSINEAKLVDEHENKKFLGSLIERIPSGIKEVIDLFDFFPVSVEVKDNAEYYATMFMENIFQAIIDKSLIHSLAKDAKIHLPISFDVTGKHNQLKIETEKNIYTITSNRDFAVKIGHLPIRTFSLSHRQILLNSSKYEIEIKYRNSFEKYNSWLNRIKREFFYTEKESKVKMELIDDLQQIENGVNVKQKGTHCNYCPFWMNCLERESIIDEHDLEDSEEEKE